jgi:methyl-accepting chemotaxis protein
MMRWLNNTKISLRLLIVILVFFVTMAGTSGFFLHIYKKGLMHLEKVRLENIVDIAEEIIDHQYQVAMKDPSVSESQGRKKARDALRYLRFSGDDYIFVYNEEGVNLVNGPDPELEGKNMIGMEDENGVMVIRELIEAAKKGQDEYVEYYWPKGQSEETYHKLSYSAYFEPWDWMVGTGVYVEEVDEKYHAALVEILITLSFSILIAGALSYAIARSITGPLGRLTKDMGRLSKNDHDFEVQFTDYKDEVGELARSLSVFKENAEEMERMREEQKESEKRQEEERRKAMHDMADQFEEKVGSIVEAVSSASESVEAAATQFSANAEESTKQSASVASASEQASTNVQTVAAATEELSAAIKDISQNVGDTAKSAKECSSSAETSKEKLKGLQKSIADIDNVLQAIMEVAEQTNLLALNATIEAARAGDAGKGFAVVASEVKSLATKTQKMTDEIAELIESVKQSSLTTVNSVEDIIGQIEEVDVKATNIASSIEEQDNSTQEISRNIQEAAQGTNEVSNNVVGIQQASDDSSQAASELQKNAANLAGQSRELKNAMNEFIKEIRAA